MKFFLLNLIYSRHGCLHEKNGGLFNLSSENITVSIPYLEFMQFSIILNKHSSLLSKKSAQRHILNFTMHSLQTCASTQTSFNDQGHSIALKEENLVEPFSLIRSQPEHQQSHSGQHTHLQYQLHDAATLWDQSLSTWTENNQITQSRHSVMSCDFTPCVFLCRFVCCRGLAHSLLAELWEDHKQVSLAGCCQAPLVPDHKWNN